LKKEKLHKILTYFIALVWLVNGLFAKVLNLVPRHEQIVGRILNDQYSRTLILIIGFLEILMTFWILSRIKAKLNAILQIVVVGLMNVLEFMLVPDLLLWGRFNALFAALFMIIIYYNEFILSKKITQQPYI